MSPLIIIVATVCGSLLAAVIRAFLIDEIKRFLSQRARARVERAIESVPLEMQETWAQGWRAQFAALAALPFTALRFELGIRRMPGTVESAAVSLERTIAALPPDLRDQWGDEWRAELASIPEDPLLAASFARGVRRSARALSTPALALVTPEVQVTRRFGRTAPGLARTPSAVRTSRPRRIGRPASFESGARILTIGIASTGVLTLLFLALASRELSSEAYGRVSLMWSVMFVILSVIYRPIEQLLSRTIAERRVRGLAGHPLRVPATIQFTFALLFLAVALALRSPVEENLYGGSSALYWMTVVGVLAYGVSYFARGWLAGHQRFALYGGLVFLESISRFLFALAAVVGITSGQSAIALGMAVAPFASLVVVPFALARVDRERAPSGAAREAPALDTAAAGRAHTENGEAVAGLTIQHGSSFAVAVFGIMLAEQTLMNAAVLIVNASSGQALAGFVFNVLLIVRAPLQLFQAIQTSILPHLAGLEARESGEEFARAIRLTVLAIAGFAGACALGLLAIGPWVMSTLLGDKGFTYERWGLALVAIGMGFHLIAGTLNQAALARRRAGLAAVAWLLCAALFVGWVAAPAIGNEVLRVETGYFGAAFLLSGLLFGLYRTRGSSLR